MAQSMITQVSRETDSYNPCPAPADGEWKRVLSSGIQLVHVPCLKRGVS